MKKVIISACIAVLSLSILTLSSCRKKGCTNPDASNYEEKAKKDDGSCIIEAIATCNDGIMNQDETDIDCGGVCTSCIIVPVATCSDGIMNQDETGIDCGGVCTSCNTPAGGSACRILQLDVDGIIGYDYVYNSNNKVEQYSDYDSEGAVLLVVDVTYNTDGKVQQLSHTGIETSTVDYAYTNGFMSTKTTYDQSSVQTKQVTYLNDGTHITGWYAENNGAITDSIAYEYTGENVTSKTKYRESNSLDPSYPNMYIRSTNTYTFDSKFNPFAEIGIQFHDFELSENNRSSETSIEYSANGTEESNESVTSTYTYNSDDFPTQLVNSTNSTVDLLYVCD